jgi:uncharacterized protein (UPF0332 family)
MSVDRDAEAYREKAVESLAGAESEFDNGRFNNSANRAYYAAFQAAIAALLRHGIRRNDRKWPHTYVQSEFAGRLIQRRHRFPSHLRDTLAELQLLGHRADYEGGSVARADARRALRRSHEIVDAVRLESDRP